MVSKVEETSGDNLQRIGLGSSGLCTGEAHRRGGGEKDLGAKRTSLCPHLHGALITSLSVHHILLLLSCHSSNISDISSANSLSEWTSSIKRAALQTSAPSLYLPITFVIVAGVPSHFCVFSQQINVLSLNMIPHCR